MYYLRDTPTLPRVIYPDPPPVPEPSASPDVSTRQTALWVWNTKELIRDEVERDVFLGFIEAESITRVFLYLASADGASPAAGYIPFSTEEIGPLVAALRARGALTYALRRPDPFPTVCGYHELFHVLVIAGVAAHSVAIGGFLIPHAGS